MKRLLIAFIFLIAQYLFYKLLFSYQTIIEYIVNDINFPIAKMVSRLTNHVNFPLGEIFYALILLMILRLVIGLMRRKIPIYSFLLSSLCFFNIAYFIYTFAWGVMYEKKTFSFDQKEISISSKALKKVYCINLENAISARNYMTTNLSDSSVLKFKTNIEDFNKEFFKIQYQLKKEKWIKNYRFLEGSHYKFSTISELQNYLGILGYYNPFTVESNLNEYNTDLKMPSTLFHEYAHQMGFASESEANFLAYYIGIHSSNSEINYSAYYKAVFSLLRSIYRVDPNFVKLELDGMDERILRDRKAEIYYYEKYIGNAGDIFSELNNQFLKANNQEGVVSYSKYVELICYLYQTQYM